MTRILLIKGHPTEEMGQHLTAECGLGKVGKPINILCDVNVGMSGLIQGTQERLWTQLSGGPPCLAGLRAGVYFTNPVKKGRRGGGGREAEAGGVITTGLYQVPIW